MKIGLIDVDGHNFPNLPLMKLSAWHKRQGDVVEFYEPLNGHYGKVYASKVFEFTPDYAYPIYADEVEHGGKGISPAPTVGEQQGYFPQRQRRAV